MGPKMAVVEYAFAGGEFRSMMDVLKGWRWYLSGRVYLPNSASITIARTHGVKADRGRRKPGCYRQGGNTKEEGVNIGEAGGVDDEVLGVFGWVKLARASAESILGMRWMVAEPSALLMPT